MLGIVHIWLDCLAVLCRSWWRCFLWKLTRLQKWRRPVNSSGGLAEFLQGFIGIEY